MSLIEAAWLGVIQALTEFLPVSSSGHLRLARGVFGHEAGGNLAFDVMLHLGTLFAVFFVYRERIAALLREGVGTLFGRGRPLESEAFQLLVLLVVATVPTGVIGLLGASWIDSPIFGVGVVGGLLIVNGGVLFLSRGAGASDEIVLGEAEGEELVAARRSSFWTITYANLGLAGALLLGVAQGVAILPGISRAGVTIVVALLLGVDRERAGEFSFFLSIPAILGAVVLESGDALNDAAAGELGIYVAGALVSAVVGVFALQALLKMLRAAQMHQFAWYCWAVGGAAVIYSVVTG